MNYDTTMWKMRRDEVVVNFCNFLLRHLTSPEFYLKLSLVIEHGMAEAEAGNIPEIQKKGRPE